MKIFQSIGTVDITGRGTGYVVALSPSVPAAEFMKWIGEPVKIDGVEGIIKGIEQFMVGIDIPQSKITIFLTTEKI